MACKNCSNHSDTSPPKGCRSNGSCSTGGCGKLSVFDWLADISSENVYKEIFVEVQFKNSRKAFLKNTNRLDIKIGDVVVTKDEKGYDVGTATLTSSLVRTQMKKRKVAEKDILEILRKATDKDLETWNFARVREEKIQRIACEKALFYKLKMKILDVEFRGDGSKATFYYTADSRVDFRKLVRDFCSSFGVRVEMKQIGPRQEASRLGGIGDCGRTLCCSSWLQDFHSVATSAARYQDLSINSQRLSGQCGKLKCCLNYDLDTYKEALEKFPERDLPLFTKSGKAFCQKADIFKQQLWYSYKDDPAKWVQLPLGHVLDIIKKNKTNEAVESLEDFERKIPDTKKISTDNLEDNSTTRFDKFEKKKYLNKKIRNHKNENEHS